MNILSKFAATVALTAMSSVALAIPVVTDGNWTSVDGTPSAGPDFIDSDSNGTNDTVSYGAPFGSSTAGSSSYVFAGVSTDAPIDGTLFALGDFTHNNFTISLPSISGATLDISLDFTGTGTSQAFTFFFDHNETPNGGDPCAAGGAQPCPDLVSIPDASSSQTVSLEGVDYLLSISGFSTDGGLTIVPSFLTEEGLPNTATLYASLEAIPAAVPEPGTLGLLALGLFGAAFRNRKA